MGTALLWVSLALLLFGGVVLLLSPKLFQCMLPALWCWDEDVTDDIIQGMEHPFKAFWPFTASGAAMVLSAAFMAMRMLS